MSGALELNIVECRRCGSAYWYPVRQAQAVDGGPCCFGHDVLDVERHSQRAATLAWPTYERESIAKIKEASVDQCLFDAENTIAMAGRL